MVTNLTTNVDIDNIIIIVIGKNKLENIKELEFDNDGIYPIYLHHILHENDGVEKREEYYILYFIIQ